jgi:hypothetical protein
MLASGPIEQKTASGWTPVAWPLAFVLASLLALPGLTSPLLQDDVVHRAMLHGKLPGLEWRPHELYDFIGAPSRQAGRLREVGFVPWFASDELRIRFFRPLSSLVTAADAVAFGERTWLSRLHSLIWFFGVLGLVAALHHRFLPARTAGLATVLYAIAFGHLMPVSWIAARYALISSAFALLSVWCHLRSREDDWRPGYWLAPVALASALLAGEIALGAVALIGAWELLARRDAIRRRVAALAPGLVLVVAYLLAYVAMDYGVGGSAAYVAPSADLQTLMRLGRHAFILAGELVAATPSDAFGSAEPASQTVAALWGAVTIAAAWGVVRLAWPDVDPRERLALRWMPVAAAGALLPGTFAIVGGRVLTLALAPATAVMAVVFVRGFAAARNRTLSRTARAIAAVVVLGFGAGQFVAGPVLRVGLGRLLAETARAQHELAARLPPCSGTMVIVAAADPTVASYVPATLLLRDRGPARLRVLSLADRDHRLDEVTRTGFDLTTLGGARERTMWERLFRQEPVPAGLHVSTAGLDVTVLEADNGAPVRLRAEFDVPLDSPELCLMQWRDRTLKPLERPAPGSTVTLPYERGPMEW